MTGGERPHRVAIHGADRRSAFESLTSGGLDGTVVSFVEEFFQGPPVVLKLANRAIHDGRDAGLESGPEYEGKALGHGVGTDDLVEAVRAFHDDREAEFQRT